jgi:sarcosine oxidase subunit beta
MTHYDVIIVGAGIVGASIARALTLSTKANVAVIERDIPSSGSSGRAAGIVTVQLWNVLDMKLVRRSIDIFHAVERESNSMLRFIRTGLVTTATKPDDAAVLKNWQARLKELGIRSELLSADELASRFPNLKFAKNDYGLFVPSDGFVNPSDYVTATLARCQDHGTEVLTGTSVDSLLEENGQVTGVRTSRGALSASKVVLACGAWIRRLLNSVGLDVPVKPYRTQLVNLKTIEGTDFPALHDIDSDFYLRPERDRTMVAGDGTRLAEVDPVSFNQSLDSEFLAEISRHISDRVRGGEHAKMTSGWAGICSSTPDRRPLVGRYHLEGLLLACGMQGYGVMRAPAIGEGVASLINHKEYSIDLSDFRAQRFTKFHDFQIREGFTLHE